METGRCLVSTMHLHTLERDLAHAGWLFVRQRGSHRHYRNAHGERLTVSLHGGRHTALCWRQVAAIRRDLARMEANRGEWRAQQDNRGSA